VPVIDGVGAAVKMAEGCWRWDWRRASAAAVPYPGRAQPRIARAGGVRQHAGGSDQRPQPVDLLIVHGTLITVDPDGA
jgi:hypothetical protein